jgi:hypothetical protein
LKEIVASTVRLLNRTTRSVVPTEVGERLLERLGLVGHVSGLLMRDGWPLALMLYADQVPIRLAHSKMR